MDEIRHVILSGVQLAKSKLDEVKNPLRFITTFRVKIFKKHFTHHLILYFK